LSSFCKFWCRSSCWYGLSVLDGAYISENGFYRKWEPCVHNQVEGSVQ
jgi:hypothetical protein